MSDENIVEMLDHLNEARDALQPRGGEFEDSLEKLTTEARYWQRVIDNGDMIQHEAVKETVEELHTVRERVQAYLDGDGWKDSRVCDAYIALLHAVNSVEEMPLSPRSGRCVSI